MSKRLTTREFVEKARAVHGNKYDYGEVEYRNNKTKVKIICPEHGGFWQRPSDHNKGRGCYDCGRKASISSRILSVDSFISKSMLVHGDKYDYSEVKYETSKRKVKIICPEHGAFWQNAGSHMGGVGCAACGITNKLDTDTFVEKAKLVHGDKYDYSEVKYETSKRKVKIICPEHGAFWQNAGSHMGGVGCAACGITNKLDTDTFVEKAKLVHGDKYDYSEVKYETSKRKVKIICPEHGAFWQNAGSHMGGVGCAACGITNKGWTKTKWVNAGKRSAEFHSYKLYLVICKNESESFFKVGRTFQKVNQRFKKSKFPYNYRTVSKIIGPSETIYNLEIEFFRAGFKRYSPKISFDGETECFHISELKKAKRWFDRNRKGVLKSAQLQLFPPSPPSFL
jgi:protein-arginine kinase activator protein McsA